MVPALGICGSQSSCSPSTSPLCYLWIHNSSSNPLGKHQPSPVWVEMSTVLHVTGVSRWMSHLSHPFGCCRWNMASVEHPAFWFGVSPSPALRLVLSHILSHHVSQGLDGARRSVIGDSPQLLTHYYDDARTMYEVFRRGFSISGESTVMRSSGSRGGERWRIMRSPKR